MNDYADELTGFEQRLLDGLREVRTEPPRQPRRNWRPVAVLAATAAAVVGAVVAVPSVFDRPEPPAPPLAQPVAPKPFSYVKAVQGTEYVTMEGGGEVKSDIRGSSELWVGNEPAGLRPMRAVLEPYQQVSCTSSVSDALCADWLGRHAELAVDREPVDRSLPEVRYPPQLGDTAMPSRIRSLVPDELVVDPVLPSDPVALGARVDELAQSWYQRYQKDALGSLRDHLEWELLVEIAGKPALSPETRSAAFKLATASPLSRVGSGVDRLGRVGTRLSVGDGTRPDGAGGTEVIFDPATSTVLSIEELRPVPPDTKRPPTPLVVSDYTLFETSTTVSSTTERP
ncbi:hypothetical protein [Amycolatopsis sp. 195334CR]|uniref:hypothetical protein n=1 Tax=Amycolatopsis sp. 195334CR TaxID=2814588 RepID=UPI001A8CD36A|nr:hypothetical protein [Amycolatopsis sp. 195334CR]MBN6034336.1 hypothetical protein [Amycolatopsis sp. 195334CR]